MNLLVSMLGYAMYVSGIMIVFMSGLIGLTVSVVTFKGSVVAAVGLLLLITTLSIVVGMIMLFIAIFIGENYE